jgi:hypothetical protein
MSVLLAGAFRYDDLAEGQLGDILYFPECVDLSVFWSKTEPASAGQAAFIPRGASPTSGASRLVQMTARGLRRLLAADPALLRTLGKRLFAALRPVDRAGPEAMATWPPPIPEMAGALYSAGVQAHVLPVFGRWLFD